MTHLFLTVVKMNNVVFWAVIPLKRTFQKQGNKHCAHPANQTSQQLRCFSREVTDHPHNGPNLTSSDSQFLWTSWLASSLQHMLTRSMPPTISYLDTHTNLFHTGIHALVPWRGTLECQKMNTWKSDVYHLLSICHVYMKVRRKFLAWHCLLPYFFKLVHSLVGDYQYFGILSTYQNFITQTTLLINIWLEKIILWVPS